METNLRKDDLVLVYRNEENKYTFREMYKTPTETAKEEFVVITDFLTACTMCNRLNHLNKL